MIPSQPELSCLSPWIDQGQWAFDLPSGARQVIASWDSGEPDNRSLTQWLASEPDLCRRLLRWCNTPLYNLATPYRSLAEASQVMDAGELSRLAILACVRGMFLPDREIDQYRRETLWSHSIAVGATAAMIARTTGCSDPGMMLVAGTLHDIGLCASERMASEAFADTVALVDELSPMDEVERELFGWDHAELGEAILNQWGLPETVTTAARHHHEPDHVLYRPGGAAVGCVALSNYLCSRAGWSTIGRHYLPPPSQRVFAQLGVDSRLLTVLWQQLHVALESVTLLR